jgi:AraC-like DNA-binding protein
VLRSRVTPLFLAQLGSRKDDLARIIAEFGLPPDAPLAEEIPLPLGQFRALTRRVAEVLSDPLLGLHTATSRPPGAYGLVEFLLKSASTPRDSIRQLLRFVPLFNNLLEVSATVEVSIPGEPQCLGREANEYALAVFVAIGRQLATEDWAPDLVAFAHPRVTSQAELEELGRFFRCGAFSFGAGCLRLVFRTNDLAKPVPTSDRALHSFLEDQGKSALASQGISDDLDPAREAIRTALQAGEPSLAEVARVLATSARTLQRRLMERGSSFRALVDDVREKMAREYLRDRTRTIKEVAHALGYADARAFGRAYKRWTGRTPGRQAAD